MSEPTSSPPPSSPPAVSEPAANAAGAAAHRRFVLVLAVGISVLFFLTVRRFLMPLVLGAMMAGLASPLFDRLERRWRGRRNLAAAATLALLAVLVLLPSLALLGAVANQAIKIGQTALPWAQEQLAQPTVLEQRMIERFPALAQLTPYRGQLIDAAGSALQRVGEFLVGSLSALTKGTAIFVLHFMLFLYALYFFLRDGRAMLDDLFELTPLTPAERASLLERLAAVSRALLRGTFVIGILQGGLAALAMWAAGIPDALFWFFLMAVLSILPGLGTFLVWGPAAVYLLAHGETAAALLLTLWCAAVVGSIDNVLRPRLVGSGAQMSDLMVLLSTLGGLVYFGAAGFIVGPLVAALFITVWGFYRETLRERLETPPAPGAG